MHRKSAYAWNCRIKSGSLYNALAQFYYNDLNMTKIDPPDSAAEMGVPFLRGFRGDLSDPAVKNALRGLQAESAKFRISEIINPEERAVPSGLFDINKNEK